MTAQRCRMPPDSWAGSSSLEPGEAEPGEYSPRAGLRVTAGDARNVQAEEHVVQHRAPWQQQVALQHVPGVAGRARHLSVAKEEPPVSGRSSPAMMLKSVLLPQPDGPTRAMNSPFPAPRSTVSSARSDRARTTSRHSELGSPGPRPESPGWLELRSSPAEIIEVRPGDASVSRCWIGVDIGTQGVRAVAVGEDGTVLARAAAERPPRFPSPGAMVHDPELDWWGGSCEALRAVTAAIADRRIDGVGLASLFRPPAWSTRRAWRSATACCTATPGPRTMSIGSSSGPRDPADWRRGSAPALVGQEQSPTARARPAPS